MMDLTDDHVELDSHKRVALVVQVAVDAMDFPIISPSSSSSSTLPLQAISASDRMKNLHKMLVRDKKTGPYHRKEDVACKPVRRTPALWVLAQYTSEES